MKRLFIILVFLFFVSACSSENFNTENTLSQMDKSNETIPAKYTESGMIIQKLAQGGLHITNGTVYSENEYPADSGSITEYKYIEKANFEDTDIEKEKKEDFPISGSIEIFSTEKDVDERIADLDRLDKDYYPVKIKANNVLVRMNENYTSGQLKRASEAIGGQVHYRVDPSHLTFEPEVRINDKTFFSEKDGVVSIESNFPAGTRLVISLKGRNTSYLNNFNYVYITVNNDGNAESKPSDYHNLKGYEGEYTIVLKTTLEQPENTKEIFGEHGQYLIGTNIKYEGGERLYQQEFTIEADVNKSTQDAVKDNSSQTQEEMRADFLQDVDISDDEMKQVYEEFEDAFDESKYPKDVEEAAKYEENITTVIASKHGITPEQASNVYSYVILHGTGQKAKNVYRVLYGEFLEAFINGTTLVVKVKIEPNLTNKMTISQNYYNACDIIRNQGGDEFTEIQYWAVADMTDGTEGKVLSFTVPKYVIDMISSGDFADNTLGEYAEDLWILPSLQD